MDTNTTNTIKYDTNTVSWESIDAGQVKLFWSSPSLYFVYVMWLLLWFSINTGPWVFKTTPYSTIRWLHYIRTLFPLIVIFLVLFQIRRGSNNFPNVIGLPAYMWFIYGIIGLLACSWSPKGLDAAYWAVAYLSLFIILKKYLDYENFIDRIVYLNYLNWVITTIFLCILLLVAKEQLFTDYRSNLTGYGVVGRVGSVAGMHMSRSSGMARFAAVPAIVSFVFILHHRSWRKIFWVAIFAYSTALVWFMQSRGAILGLAFALSFVLVFSGKKSRILGLVLLLGVGSTAYVGQLNQDSIKYVKEHFYRGQSIKELKTMTGRTRAWKKALNTIKKSPIFGWGPQADRYFMKEHVHNTYLYAALEGGIIGVFFFISGLVWSWWLFLKLLISNRARGDGHWIFFIQCAGILAFFTVRSIPEVCGAMFGVDTMILVPIMVYLGIANHKSTTV